MGGKMWRKKLQKHCYLLFPNAIFDPVDIMSSGISTWATMC